MGDKPAVRKWTGWLIKTGGPLVTLAGAAFAYIQSLRTIRIKNPDLKNPDLLDQFGWVVCGGDSKALIALVAPAFGFMASVCGLFGPKPYTEEQAQRTTAMSRPRDE